MGGELLVDSATSGRLGSAAVLAMVSQLRFGICQSCGQAPERDQAGSVVVDELDQLAVATIHHPDCARPGWRTRATRSPWSAPHLTRNATAVLLPLTGTRTPGPTPTVLVTPGLEQVVLARTSEGSWEPTMTRFEVLGMRRPGREHVSPKPLPESHAQLAATTSYEANPPGPQTGHPTGPGPKTGADPDTALDWGNASKAGRGDSHAPAPAVDPPEVLSAVPKIHQWAIKLELATIAGDSWVASLDPATLPVFTAEATATPGRILAAVTQSLDPASITNGSDLAPYLATGQILCGWVQTIPPCPLPDAAG